jgi:hypothetical protein
MDTALARLFLIAVAKPPSGDITSWAWIIKRPWLAALASPLRARRYDCGSGSLRKSLRRGVSLTLVAKPDFSQRFALAPLQTQQSRRNQSHSLSA